MRSVFFVFLLCLISSNLLIADEYKIAVRALKGIEAANKQWLPTIDMLNAKLPNHVFTLLPILSLNEITRRAGSRDFDFLLTNPSSYIEVNKLFGAKALVTLNNRRGTTAQSRFGSVIFTHVRNQDILKIKDLQDKTLMVVSEPAFGGWRVAWLEMLEQGFNPQRQLKKLVFTKSKTQQEVVQSVLDGKVDAGVVRTDLLERMETAGKIDMRYLRIINNKDLEKFPFFLSTKLYPEWAFSAMNFVPRELSQQVKQILLSVRPDDEAAQKGVYVGWLPPSDYSTVRELLKRLEIEPSL